MGEIRHFSLVRIGNISRDLQCFIQQQLMFAGFLSHEQYGIGKGFVSTMAKREP